MKKTTLKKLGFMILGSILTLAIVFAVPQVNALVATRTATVTNNDIKVNIDGVPVILTDLEGNAVEPIIVFDTLYAPVSPLARAFGKTSTYDGNANTVYINTSTPLPPKIGETVKLSDLNYFTRAGNYFVYHDEVRDNTDTYRKDCLIKTASGTTDYLLNKEYSHITGTAFLTFDHRTTTRDHYVKIYGDGKLLYESPRISGGVKPFEFRVDLTDVDIMKISIEGDGAIIGLSETIIYKR